ncbi:MULTISPECIES: hypothetical protein [Candidatus Cardinium]|uniref:hypothetical protein n=1 Tax=Candidatus Cardinium TaxID=273135 RepID=UPI001FA9E7A2|nr:MULTISPECIES: hypothetical protein [Cardinium]
MKYKTLPNFLLHTLFLCLAGSLCNKIRDKNMCQEEICADCGKKDWKPCSGSSTERSNPNHPIIRYYVNCIACQLYQERARQLKQQDNKNNKENTPGPSK